MVDMEDEDREPLRSALSDPESTAPAPKIPNLASELPITSNPKGSLDREGSDARYGVLGTYNGSSGTVLYTQARKAVAEPARCGERQTCSLTYVMAT